jgi:hypothetical protein
LRSSRLTVECPQVGLPVGEGTPSALSCRQISRIVVPATRSVKMRRTITASGSKISRCAGPPAVLRGRRR